MTLSSQLNQEIQQLVGQQFSPARTVSVIDPRPLELQIDFAAVDTISCSVEELRLSVPSLSSSGLDQLKQWAESLCQRVTYLLENIGPLEYDQNGNQVLIRSTPPHQHPTGKQFYEILLQSRSGGHFVLRRFRSVQGQQGRSQVEMQMTHELLSRLVDDLSDTIPSTP